MPHMEGGLNVAPIDTPTRPLLQPIGGVDATLLPPTAPPICPLAPVRVTHSADKTT